MSFLPVAFFALGAVVASFIGALAQRLHTGESVLIGRSRCDACSAPLTPFALIPIISYVAFGGRARCCGARLSRGAPATELLLGGFFAFAYWKIGLALALPLMLLSLALLMALVLYDLAHQILPPPLLLAFVAAGAATGFLLAGSPAAFFATVPIALLIASGLALVHFFSRGKAMGLSDAPLTFGLSLLFGQAALPGLIFSFWIGAVVGIVVLARRPVGSRMGVEVPFAPYLAAGFLLAYITQWNPFTLIAVLP